MAFSLKVSVKKDDKVLRKILRNLSKTGSHNAVEVGWWNSRHPTGVPVAQVAAWNEEGHMTGMGGYSPPRPFLTIGFMGKLKRLKYSKYMPLVAEVAMGRLSWAVLNRTIAEDMVNLMKKSILDWNTPPNSPLTIALKGHGEVLIDSGTLYDSIKSRVVRKT